jgi:hypothetical protein
MLGGVAVNANFIVFETEPDEEEFVLVLRSNLTLYINETDLMRKNLS